MLWMRAAPATASNRRHHPLRKPPCKQLGAITGVVKVACASEPGGVKHTTAHKCKLHGRCLPYWNGPWADEQRAESSLYTICHGCPDYQRIEQGD